MLLGTEVAALARDMSSKAKRMIGKAVDMRKRQRALPW